MARILGLDLGSATLKAVYLDSAQRAAPVQRYLEVARPQEGERLDTLKAALRELTADITPAELDQTVVCLPGPALATHAFTLPFKDGKQIEAALPFEVENQLPFDLTEAVYDYQPTHRTEDHTDLLVSVMRLEELKTLLAALAEMGLDPRIVTHPALSYQLLMPALAAGRFSEPSVPFAVVDIGHERTSVAIANSNGELELARTFSGGGRDLSKALAAELQVSLAEATHWKEQQGAVGPAAEGLGADAERVSAALLRGLAPVLRELRPTLKAYTARKRENVGRIVLCGGTAKLPGLLQQLANDLQVPVELLTLPDDATVVIPARDAPVAAQAYALAMRGQATGQRAPRFNLRRGELAFKGHFDFVRERVAQLAIFAAVLIALCVGQAMVRNNLLAKREAEVDQKLCQVTQQTLGRCEKNFDKALSLLQGSQSAAASIPKYSAVNLLAEMTQRVPQDMNVTFEHVRIENDRIELKGTADSSKEIDRLTAALKTFRCFKDFQEGKVEKVKDKQRVTFNMDVNVSCPEQPSVPTGS